MCENPENLSIQSVFMLSTLRLRHAENLAGKKKPEKTGDFWPSRMDKVELIARFKSIVQWISLFAAPSPALCV
jgi:hypothetical protein